MRKDGGAMWPPLQFTLAAHYGIDVTKELRMEPNHVLQVRRGFSRGIKRVHIFFILSW